MPRAGSPRKPSRRCARQDCFGSPRRGPTEATRPARAVTAIAAGIGRGCSSASRVLVVYYSAALALWLYPDQVRHQVWGHDPDATVCGSSAGAVPAQAAEGGYLLTGRWGWSSGAHHASWAILDIVTGADGPSPGRGVVLVPMSELSVEDTWHMAGRTRRPSLPWLPRGERPEKLQVKGKKSRAWA